MPLWMQIVSVLWMFFVLVLLMLIVVNTRNLCEFAAAYFMAKKGGF